MELSAKQTGVLWGSETYNKGHGLNGYQVTPPPSVTDRKSTMENPGILPPHWISPNILKDMDTFIVVWNCGTESLYALYS